MKISLWGKERGGRQEETTTKRSDLKRSSSTRHNTGQIKLVALKRGAFRRGRKSYSRIRNLDKGWVHTGVPCLEKETELRTGGPAGAASGLKGETSKKLTTEVFTRYELDWGGLEDLKEKLGRPRGGRWKRGVRCLGRQGHGEKTNEQTEGNGSLD